MGGEPAPRRALQANALVHGRMCAAKNKQGTSNVLSNTSRENTTAFCALRISCVTDGVAPSGAKRSNP